MREHPRVHTADIDAPDWWCTSDTVHSSTGCFRCALQHGCAQALHQILHTVLPHHSSDVHAVLPDARQSLGGHHSAQALPSCRAAHTL